MSNSKSRSHSASSGGSKRSAPRPDRIARFEVRDYLGGGAFGDVWRAYDPQLEREVAIKVPKPGSLTTPRRVERFLGDAKTAAQLRHPHIVPVFDCGKFHRESEGEVPYIASAYIPGQTLAEAAAAGPMPFLTSSAIVMKLADALDYAHRCGIVHRDVKPHNVMLDPAGEPHIIDFGLAQRGGEAEEAGKSVGTPSYMSPEQAAGQGGEARPAFDQYSLGVTLYELLTGDTPFSGPSGSIQKYHHVNTVPPPLRELNPDVPLDLQLICLKTLAKHPDNRYPSCEALAADLRAWLAGRVPSVRTLTRRERFVRWVRTEPKLAGAVGSVGLLVVVLAIMGVAFGAAQRNKNAELTRANEATEKARERAVANEVVATENAARARGAERDATSKLAAATFDRAVAVGEQGEVGQCLVDLARALVLAERADDADLVGVIRQNLAGWRRQAHRLAGIRSTRVPPGWMVHDPSKPDAVLYGSLTRTDAEHVLLCHLADESKPTNFIRLTWAATIIRTVAASPDGKVLLAVSEGGTACVFDATSGKPLSPIISPQSVSARFLSGAVFPGGSRIALGDSAGRVSIFEFVHGGWTRTLSAEHTRRVGPDVQVRALAVHPTGLWLLSAGGTRLEGEIIVWDTSSLARAYTLPQNGEKLLPVTAAAFAPEVGDVFVTGHGTLLNGEARVWDAATGTPVRNGVLKHQAEVNAVVFSPDGRFLATASQDRAARVFDCESWGPVGQPLWHGKDVRAVAFTADNRKLITGANEGTDGGAIRVWELAPGASAGPPLQLGSPVFATALDPTSDRLFAGGFGASVWNARDRTPVPGAWLHGFPMLAAEYHPHGKWLLLGSGTADAEGSAVILDAESNVVGRHPHPRGVLSVAFSPTGDRFATGCADGFARVWGLTPPSDSPVEIPHHPKGADGKETGRVYVVKFSPDGRYLLTGGTDKRAVLWDLKSPRNPKPAHVLPHPDVVLSASFGGGRIVVGYGGAVAVWNWSPGTVPEPDGLLLHGPAGVFAVDISPDARTVLTAGTDGTARWWDLKTRKPLGPMWHPGPTAKTVAFRQERDTRRLRFVTSGTDLRGGRVMVIDKPAEVAQGSSHVTLWVEACTGIGSRLAVLDPDEWGRKRRLLSLMDELQVEVEIRKERATPGPAWPSDSAAKQPVVIHMPKPPEPPSSIVKRSTPDEDVPKSKDPSPPMPATAVVGDADLFVGKWTSDLDGIPITVEFTEKGTLHARADLGGKEYKFDGTYKLDGDKLRIKLRIESESIEETVTITKIVENEIKGKDKDGKEATFKRIGPAPRIAPRPPVKPEPVKPAPAMPAPVMPAPRGGTEPFATPPVIMRLLKFVSPF